MTRRHRGRGARAGFTLIELLVVIAIIAVLVSLTSAAVMMILNKGPQVVTRTETGNLEGGVANAKSNLNNVSYIPSRLVLREDGLYGSGTGQQQVDELRTQIWLQQAFGKRIARQIDWNNNGQIDPAPGGVVTLNGAQCLVFVLGGIQVNGAPTGFSTNPANPAQLGGSRKGPFYEFKQNRLVADPTNPNGYLIYLDAYSSSGVGKPYLYMSWYGKGNDYNFGNNSDCAGWGVTPYTANGRFINANGIQIISAGKDGQFGPGGNWNPANGYGGGSPGTDDIANFSQAMLGVPQS